jgi:superfamily I DNA/RNA helicase
MLPIAPIDALKSLPSTVTKPDVAEANVAPVAAEAIGEEAEDQDVIISRPTEGAKHLFSLKYAQWVDPDGPLTRQQRRVINQKVHRPLRIHGPGGSGKTLVLILKALHLLREAHDSNTRCHILVVVTSAAVQGTVRTAIEAIDEQLFLATTQADRQFLDVDTLHGWCIRKLGLGAGPGQVLERDPKASKALQFKILSEVFEEVFVERYDRLRDLLSSDFRARIDGKREQLIRDLQWEIAIRIKGRGLRRPDRDLYINSATSSFIGRRENHTDRHFLFHVYDRYEKRFHDERLLDTDDVVLSMVAPLSTSLWDRQRAELGYDYVMVDETHLFNENERRVLPLLTRGTTEYPPVVMTFDEAQSIGGQRGLSLEAVGIAHSERRNLSIVHRSSPDIFALARDLVERSPLMFREFGASTATPRMSDEELRRCRKPVIVEMDGEAGVLIGTANTAAGLRDAGYRRVGIIIFDRQLFVGIWQTLQSHVGASVYEVEERGERLAAVPRPGIYVMLPEACGGLEFDAVILIGVEEGRVPPPIGELSAEGYWSAVEESYVELYTAITRAKYALIFLCDATRGVSDLVRPCVSAGLLEEDG